MAKKFLTLLFALIVIVSLVGCSSASNTGKRAGTGNKKDESIPAKDRSQVKIETVSSDGQKKKVSYYLVDSAKLEFTTYRTDDLFARLEDSNKGNALYFYAFSDCEKNEDAFLRFFAKPKSTKTTVEELAKLAKADAAGRGFEVKDGDLKNPKHDFSEAEFDIKKQTQAGKGITGYISVFKHGERVYSLTVQYPEDLEKSFMPHVGQVIKDIKWYDEK